MNFFSHHIRSLFHQDHRNPHAELARHGNDGDPGSHLAGMALANRAKEFSELAVLADGRPRSLDKLTSKPPISDVCDRSPIGFISRRVLGGRQAQKACQLANIFNLSPIPDSSQKLARYNPADPGDRHQILNALRQFRIAATKPADLLGRLKNSLLRELQAVEQLIELKANGVRTRKLSKLRLHDERPLTASRSGGKLYPFHEQQRFNALLHSHHLADKGIPQLTEVAQLAI